MHMVSQWTYNRFIFIVHLIQMHEYKTCKRIWYAIVATNVRCYEWSTLQNLLLQYSLMVALRFQKRFIL